MTKYTHLTPRKKAQVAADIVAGLSYTEIAKKRGISRGTITRISKEFNGKTFDLEVKAEETQRMRYEILEKRRAEFQLELMDFLQSAVSMVKQWTILCQDPEFVINKPLGANELGRTALDFADRIVARTLTQNAERPIDNTGSLDGPQN